jgi:hypothetical protein
LRQNKQIYSDAGTRAMLGEELKTLFVIQHGSWQNAIKKGIEKDYSDIIATQYKVQFGQDLRALKLDGKGLHP